MKDGTYVMNGSEVGKYRFIDSNRIVVSSERTGGKEETYPVQIEGDRITFGGGHFRRL